MTVSRDAPAWAHMLADDISRELRQASRGFPAVLPRYLKADLPDAARWVGAWIFVTDATGGPIPAFSDGAAWRNPSNAVIS